MMHLFRKLCLTGFLFTMLWLGGFVLFIALLPKEPQDAEAAPVTEAIVVLTGGSERLINGIELLKKSRAPKLFVSGVGKGVKVEELFHQVDFGDPEMQALAPRIYLGHEANSTHTNALEVKKWVDNNQVASILLVTSNYHMFRSVTELRAVMPNITIIKHPVSPMNVIHTEWWRFPNTATLLFTEYNKFLFVSVRVWANQKP